MKFHLSKGNGSFISRSIRFGVQPLFTNAYALISNNILTAIVSYIFWIIAARKFGDVSIGLASAIFSAMMIIDIVTNFGLSTGLIKFLGSDENRENGKLLINTTITIRIIFGTLTSYIFVIGTSLWSTNLIILKNWDLLLLFILLIVFNSIYTLLSGVLVALRNARNIMLISAVFNIFKLSLIALVPTETGLFGAVLVVVIALFITTVFELAVLLPKVYSGYSFKFSIKVLPLHSFFTYAFANQIADTLVTLPQMILPLIVLNRLGPEANAYFYTTLMTTGFLRAAILSIAQSTFAETVTDQNQQFLYLKKSILLSMVVILIGGSLLLYFSPYLLRLFGEKYLLIGKPIFVWLLASAIPFTFVNLLVTIYRVKKNLKTLMTISFLWAFTSLLGAYLGILNNELIGLVSGWVFAQILIALVLCIIFFVTKSPVSKVENNLL